MTLPRLNNLNDLEALLRRLHAEPVIEGIGFDMQRDYDFRKSTKHDCGSACCIGGWIQACNPETQDVTIEDAVLVLAGGGNIDEAYGLCYPSEWRNRNNGESFYDAQPLTAAHAVAIFRDEGIANWPEALRRARAELGNA